MSSVFIHLEALDHMTEHMTQLVSWWADVLKEQNWNPYLNSHEPASKRENKSISIIKFNTRNILKVKGEEQIVYTYAYYLSNRLHSDRYILKSNHKTPLLCRSPCWVYIAILTGWLCIMPYSILLKNHFKETVLFIYFFSEPELFSTSGQILSGLLMP